MIEVAKKKAKELIGEGFKIKDKPIKLNGKIGYQAWVEKGDGFFITMKENGEDAKVIGFIDKEAVEWFKAMEDQYAD